jgi:aromatic ring-opening dioxygenase LigB subunit
MPVSFACATSHAPGITAWAEAAPAEQKDALYAGFGELRDALAASRTEVLVLLTSEHWANFFLDHIPAFCIGRADKYRGPIEPWLKVDKAEIAGDPDLAAAIINAAYENDVEPSFAHELEFDHGTMVPLHFLTPKMDKPVVPVMFNTLAAPQPSARRCLQLGKIIGDVAARSPKRVGIIATGGLSHDPGERNHGVIATDFDHKFMDEMARGDVAALSRYSSEDFAKAGAGAFELLSWVALAGALGGRNGHVVAYQAVKPWATGIGMMLFDPPPALSAAA